MFAAETITVGVGTLLVILIVLLIFVVAKRL